MICERDVVQVQGILRCAQAGAGAGARIGELHRLREKRRFCRLMSINAGQLKDRPRSILSVIIIYIF